MLVVLRFDVTDESAFLDQGERALEVLAARPGYQGGQLCRAYDDPSMWCLSMSWESVGAYRRALGNYEVKLAATALLGSARPEPSAFEPLATAAAGGPAERARSDRATAPAGPGERA